MIKANELRIGNLVLIDGVFAKLMTIGMNDMETIFSYRCQPIPLTPAILEKAGFRHYANNWYEIKFGDTIVSIDFKDYEMIIEDAFSDGVSFPTKIKNLHQLQNVTFFITGEELIINL